MSAEEGLKQQYMEAVRLYLWYSGSKYSYHTGKASKELAQRYKNVAHQILDEVSRQR